VTKDEMHRLIVALEEIQSQAAIRIPLIQPDPVWNMVLFLMKQHLDGRLVTPTSLAAAARVPYTTAVRRAEEMRTAGLLIRRPRTSSGLTYSLHPSRELVRQTYAYAQRIKTSIDSALGESSSAASSGSGRAPLERQIIPGPAVLPRGLGYRQTLRILLYADAAFDLSDNLQREISYLLGGNVRITALPLDDIRNRTLENAERSLSQFDIVAVDLPWVGEYAKHKVLTPLDDLISRYRLNTADFHAADWAAARYHKVQYGIPLHTNVEVLMARRDIFRATGLDLPSTTGQLLAAARELHRPEKEMFGITWSGMEGSPVAHAFMHFMADFGQPVLALRRGSEGFDATHISGEEYRPAIDSEGGRLAAEFMRELLEVSPPNVLKTSWREQIEMFSGGSAALSYSWSVRASRFELDPSSPAWHNTAFLPHPSGLPSRVPISPIGGFVLGIPANIDPERLDLAWRAIDWLTAPELIKLFVQQGGFVSPRFSVAADSEVRKLSPVFESVDRMARNGALHLWPRPPVPEYTRIVDVLASEIHAMLRGDKAILPALRTAQNAIDRIMRESGHYA
jgi:multiple sugar transport system substrate-binding protein